MEFVRQAKLWTSLLRQEPSSDLLLSVPEAIKHQKRIKPLPRREFSDDANAVCKVKEKKLDMESRLGKAVSKLQTNTPNPSNKCGKASGSKARRSRLRNILLEGTYHKVCKHAKYEPVLDLLSCDLNGKVISMKNPFRCYEDIHINPQMELSC